MTLLSVQAKRPYPDRSVLIPLVKVQWNAINKTTFGPWKFGRINGVVGLTEFSNKRMCGLLPVWATREWS